MQLIEREMASANPDEEWAVRVELAALYRLAAMQGWDDVIFTHVSARVPGPEHHFFINPLGLMFEEITASSLVKVDLDGNIIGDANGAAINRAGFVIHAAIHAARADAAFVIHLHTLDGMAVSAQKEGLLPLNQTSLGIIPRLAYHDYEGIAFDLEEQERLVGDLGNRTVMLLRNHGTLSIGETPGEAWMLIYALERACALQIRALSAGRDGLLLAPDNAVRKVADQVLNSSSSGRMQLAWNALIRQVQRRSPGFDI